MQRTIASLAVAVLLWTPGVAISCEDPTGVVIENTGTSVLYARVDGKGPIVIPAGESRWLEVQSGDRLIEVERTTGAKFSKRFALKYERTRRVLDGRYWCFQTDGASIVSTPMSECHDIAMRTPD